MAWPATVSYALLGKETLNIWVSVNAATSILMRENGTIITLNVVLSTDTLNWPGTRSSDTISTYWFMIDSISIVSDGTSIELLFAMDTVSNGDDADLTDDNTLRWDSIPSALKLWLAERIEAYASAAEFTASRTPLTFLTGSWTETYARLK
jgi:hypothetical protein